MARDVGTMGEIEADEMSYWTQEEYEKFIAAIKDKPQSFYDFKIVLGNLFIALAIFLMIIPKF